MFKNKKPPSVANARTAIALAPENGTLRKNRISISGSSRRSSYSTSATKDATEAANKARIGADVQPLLGPSMMAEVSVASAAITST